MTKQTLRKAFSIERIALLVRNRALEDFPALAIGTGIVLGLNLLSLVIEGKAAMNKSDGQPWTFVISLAGILLASAAFRGMHDGRAGTDWILLPATGLEKYAAALLSYLILLPIVASIVAVALSALLSLIGLVLVGTGGQIWNPLAEFGLKGYIGYATACLVLAAGSATFRKRALIKTFGVAVVYLLAAAGILIALMYFARRAAGLPVPGISFLHGDFNIDGDFSFDTPPAVDTILAFVRYALVPVSALLFGYFRVAEKEARDEVQ
jgi:hypothetical protein